MAEKYPSIELLLMTLPGHGVNRHVPVQDNAEARWRLGPHHFHSAMLATARQPAVKALAKLAAQELLSLNEHFGPFGLLGFSVGATASNSLRALAMALLGLSLSHLGGGGLWAFGVKLWKFIGGYALAHEMTSRGRKPLKLYVAGRAGPKVCFRPPGQEDASLGWEKDLLRTD